LKIKITLSITVMILFGLKAGAHLVSVSDAQTVALNFFKSTVDYSDTRGTLSVALNFTQREADGTVDFYVFDINPVHGFVIVSATDNVIPILGYSTETNFRSDFPEIGIKGWLHHIASRIHGAVILNMPASSKAAALWSVYRQSRRPETLKSTVVSPMLTTQWNQNPYYNLFCPFDHVNQGLCVTGCCATAMAQIMKYWAYPAHGIGSISYADSVSNGFQYNIGTITANFGATTYQWAQMPAQVSGSSDDTAVATLMFQCAAAAGTDFGINGSSASVGFTGYYNAYSAFSTYFGYDADSLQYQQMMYYDSASWMPMILKELYAGRPVLYSGTDSINNSGHGWVCDGYDGNEMLHMNWGWGGQDDGYFNISDLNASPYNFTWFQTALIGIQPPHAPAAVNNVPIRTGYKLFPNPAISYLTIEGNAGNNQVEYAVYDILGNQRETGMFTGYANKIDVSDWATGVYFMKLENGSAITTIRFVKE
jgi:hypothetical protein